MHRATLISAFALVAIASFTGASAEAPLRFRQRAAAPRFVPQRPNGRFARLEEAPAQAEQQPGAAAAAAAGDSVDASSDGYHYPKPVSSGYNYPKPDQAFPLPGEQPVETESEAPTEAPTTPGDTQDQATTTADPVEGSGDYDEPTAAPAVDDSLEATTVASADTATNAKLRRRQQLVNPIRYTQFSQRLEQPVQPTIQRPVYLINLPESTLQQLLLLNSPLAVAAQPTIQLAPEPATVLLSELDYVYKKKRSV
ncbi:uncharacterized protein LOC126572551 [Anopheles aquasalis]|uniref:uncharacterized protein LOC126572551 n=1 Tax=Anopheles aquasalis TaxID=42839 RepID=UPI00215AF5D4|nr:uncharacterized protein LOC126572551 [Anopheles aquasalis]